MAKRLWLVNPPTEKALEGFPGSLPQMKTWAEKSPDVDVGILDLAGVEQNENAIVDALSHYELQESYVGITATTATYQSSLRTARALKKSNPDVTVILGGHHVKEAQKPSKDYVSLSWQEYRGEAAVVLQNHSEIDLCCTGEGERTLDDLLSGKPVEEVRGIAYRTDKGIVKNPLADRLIGSDLDTISIKNFDEESLRKMRQFGNVNYISATGCPLECSFCSVGRERVESKSLSRKMEELEYLISKFPQVQEDERISIQDNFFGKSVRDTRLLCEAIIARHEEDSSFYFNWDCQTRVESMTDPTLTDLMKEAGCVAVYLGVENFSEEVLDYLKKPIAKDVTKYMKRARTSIGNLLDSDIDVYMEYQTGMPMETEEHRRENIEALRELGKTAAERGKEITVFMSLSVVYSGTNLAHGMFRDGAPREAFETFTEWEDQKEGLRGYLGRNFAHGTGGIPTGVIDMEAFNSGEIRFDYNKLLAIDKYLAEIRKIEGIHLFDYQACP
jgi:radical SAM superfamily enzyme YgiQ (UPF0313 family)